ncbi:ABC transporter ATP-binding protein [Haloechinothrix sp. YIM 98757]|uniref:ABC transporter ATP-binding protein n=1 Tax=Haloechinothrix aidingensis TaxID=2752311 RepID=A0A838ABQ9_9PSEU|nr:ABC transporter ATP-binding protein [Haloechinothrix aidingensis]MBA0126618.1 ABC transporter ATP-binding protein [Haloechinothrix aidingensis]
MGETAVPAAPEASPAAGEGISAAHVRRTFGNVVAVDDMGLTAPAGQVTALVGPNGSGKTTLLLVLATLLVPDAGEIRVAGHDPVREPREVRSRIGWMPDAFGTYDTLTPREVLQFVAAAYRLPRDRHAARARELLALVHLEDLADRPVHVLSRGQKQRLGLARALVHDPGVLLLDEPAAGLDPRSRIELRGILRDLAADGRALLVSSHVLAELEEIADRAVFVDGGRTVDEHDLTELRPTQRRPWRLRSLDQESLLSRLDGLGVTVTGQPGPAGVDVMLAGDEEAADLVAALVRDGVRVVECAPAAGTLEAAYLEMTEGRR